MGKNIIIISFAAIAILVAIIGVSKSQKSVRSNELLTKNIEALSSKGESEGQFVIYNFCSKKEGDVYCSKKRGNRKWVLQITSHIGHAPSLNDDYYCEECPDQDFDYLDD